MANITFQGGRKPKNTWLAGKMKCGHCGRALKSMGNRAGTQYLRCTKRADNMSCEGCGTLRTAEFEQFVYEAMVHKLSEFQTLTAKAETVNPRLTALNVELAQVEDEIEKLLNNGTTSTLTTGGRWPTSFSLRSKLPPSAFLLSGKSDFLPPAPYSMVCLPLSSDVCEIELDLMILREAEPESMVIFCAIREELRFYLNRTQLLEHILTENDIPIPEYDD